MDAILIIVAVLFLAGAAFFVYSAFKLRDGDKGESHSLLMLQNQLTEIRGTLDSKLSESTKAIQSQFGESTKIIKEITQELTKVNEGQAQVVNITEQLRSLQDVLKNTKQRGNVGEYSLELILENNFAHSYEKQYQFKNGEKVDFVIKVGDRLVPIDSKFSLENYQRLIEAKDDSEKERYETAFKADMKARIDETSKYVRPDEGTLEFAFMFIPAEAIYYDLLTNHIGATKSNTRDMVVYAWEKRVVIVSPTSLVAYLQTVLQGLKALKIEESAKQIQKWVGDLARHLDGYQASLIKLGDSIDRSKKIYNDTEREFEKIDKDILRINNGPKETIEGPKVEDDALF